MKQSMKKTILFTAAAALLFAGCTKKSDDYSGSLAESVPEDAPIEIITDSEIPTESTVSIIESTEEPAESAPEIIAPMTIEPEVIEKQESELPPIGTKAEGEFIYHRKLTNGTDTGITGVCVKDQWMDDFSDSLVSAGDTWKTGEKRDFYYNTEESQDAAAETEKKAQYRLHLLFEDGTEATLYEAPLADFDEAEILEEDGYYYLRFKSLSTKEEVSTLKDEKDYRGSLDSEDSDENNSLSEDTSAGTAANDETANEAENTNDGEEEYEPIGEIEDEGLQEIPEDEEEVTEFDDDGGEDFFEVDG